MMRASSAPEIRLFVTPTHRCDNLCCNSTTKVTVNPNAPVSELVEAYCSKVPAVDLEIVEAIIGGSTPRLDETIFCLDEYYRASQSCCGGYGLKATINLVRIRLYALGDWQLQMSSSGDEISNAAVRSLKPEVWLPTGREPIKVFLEDSPAPRLV